MGKANLPCLRGRIFYLALLLIFFFPSAHLFGQNSITVTGTIKDDKGIPLAAVSVVVKGTSNHSAQRCLRPYEPDPGTVPIYEMRYEKYKLMGSFTERQTLDLLTEIHL